MSEQCQFRDTSKSRVGLYIMVILIWMKGCENETKLDSIIERLDKIQPQNVTHVTHDTQPVLEKN